MSSQLVAGFLLGLAYAAPIGSQNLFVISQSLNLKTHRRLGLALTVAIMDISLAVGCVLGIGIVLDGHPVARAALGTFGGLYLIYLAVESFRSLGGQHTLIGEKHFLSWTQIITKAFLLTWLNPHAIIDGSSILGSYSAFLAPFEKTLFMTGVGMASLLWFVTISSIASLVRGARGSVFIGAIKTLSASTIVYFGLGLVISSITDWLRV